MTDKPPTLREALEKIAKYSDDGWAQGEARAALAAAEAPNDGMMLAREYEALIRALCESNNPVSVLADWTAHAGLPAPRAAAEAEEGWRPKARPLDEWHEDFGDVLWWRFPVDEPPYVGTPLDTDWPGYHTHWTDIPIPLPPPPAGSEPR